MKYSGSWLVRGFLAALLLAGNARASTIFFDNFQQFPGGTVLSPTNYIPIVGPSATVTNGGNPGQNPTTAVASNFLGSTQVFFEPGTVPYGENYEGDIATTQIDQIVTLSFTLWIPATKTANHIGGFGVNVLTINTNNNDAPLIFFNDDGRVVVFTNAPSITPLDLPLEQIGTWTALKNTVMTNVLVLDYPAGTFSFSINGAVLTNNMAIPAFVTNIFDAARLQVFEGVTGAGSSNSLGNSFALGNVQLTVPSNSTNQDVAAYIAAAKGQMFDQLSSGAPTLSPTGFSFHVEVDGTSSNTVLSATDQLPGGSNVVVSLDGPGSSEAEFNAGFTNKAALDAAFLDSLYTMTIDTADDGTFTPAMSLPGDDYPNPPQLLNFAAAQAIDPSTNFDFVWGSFTNGTTNDIVRFEIDDQFGNAITNSPGFGEPGQLDGTVTNFLIASGTLIPGSTNTGSLLFVKVLTRDTNSVPGALGMTGYFEQTQFSIVAGGTTVCVFAISPTNAIFGAAGGSGGVNITAQNGCAWTATNNNGFITITSGKNGSGDGSISYSVPAITNFSGQTGTLTIAGQTFTVVQTGVGCTFLLNSTSASFSASGGSSNVLVSANATNDCVWTAVSNSGFITITGGSGGSGNGTVSYTVATNVNAIAETGSMTIAGQTYTITEAAAPCDVSPASTSANFSAAGGSSNIVITANGTNCAWTALSNSSFITITAGTNGVGNGTVNYTVAANTNTIGQTGSMTVAGQTFTVTEAALACDLTLGSTNASYSAAGGSSNVVVSANGTNCAWTAVSNNGFITITAGTNGVGNGTVSYSVAANTNTTELVGTMTIAGQTFTVTQAASCGFTLSPASVALTEKGGSKKVSVKVKVKGGDCPWTAVSNNPFITITSGSSGSGKGTVEFTVPGNTNTTVLTGTITIAGETVTVNQAAGGCTFKLSPKDGKFKATGGTGTVKVNPNLSDCDWTAASNDGFITITGGASGTGKGTVTYTIPANSGTNVLTGTMTIGGETFTVTQSGVK